MLAPRLGWVFRIWRTGGSEGGDGAGGHEVGVEEGTGTQSARSGGNAGRCESPQDRAGLKEPAPGTEIDGTLPSTAC